MDDTVFLILGFHSFIFQYFKQLNTMNGRKSSSMKSANQNGRE